MDFPNCQPRPSPTYPLRFRTPSGCRGPPNALPFSGGDAAERVPRCYTNVPAASPSAATACSTTGRCHRDLQILASESLVAPRQSCPVSKPFSSSSPNLCAFVPSGQDFASYPRSIPREIKSVQEQIDLDRSIPLVERLAVQRRAPDRAKRGRVIVRCNGLFGSAAYCFMPSSRRTVPALLRSAARCS